MLPVRAGEIRASRNTIVVGGTVDVTSQNLTPSTLSHKFQVADGSILSVSCSEPGGASGAVDPTPYLTPSYSGSTTATLRGCAVGTTTVRLIATDDGSVLDTVDDHRESGRRRLNRPPVRSTEIPNGYRGRRERGCGP